MTKISDEYQTPLDLFKELYEVFGPFFWDACCTKENCLIGAQMAIMSNDNSDYLRLDIQKLFKEIQFNCVTNRCGPLGRSIFMNPPYSNPEPFLKKAWEDAKLFRVVCLVPVSIISNKYMDFLDNQEITCTLPCDGSLRRWVPGVTIHNLSRRVKFTHPSKKTSSPPFACCIIVMDRR